jgi:hypothetical protein
MTPEEQIRKFKDKYGVRIKKTLAELSRISGKRTMDLVYVRTKAGLGSDGTELKRLSDSYKRFRERWSAFLDESTDPGTSNLTATGQLLDAMYLRVVGPRFFIKVNNKKRSEGLGGEELVTKTTKSKSGKSKSTYESKYSNDQIRKFQEDAGREFLKLSDGERADLEKFCKEWLSEALADILNKK